MYFTKKNLVLPIVISLAFLGGLYLYSAKNSNVNKEQANLITSPSPDLTDNVNDGVYINNRFNFKFEYPIEKFPDEYPEIDYLHEQINGFKKVWPSADHRLWLTVEVRDYEKAELFPYHKQLIDKEVGFSTGKRDEYYAEKLENIGDYSENGVTYYQEFDNSAEAKITLYAYNYAWKEGDRLFNIQMAINNDKQRLKREYKTFEEIINSLGDIN